MDVFWVVEATVLDCWTYCEALGFTTFPFTIFRMCSIWNVYNLSYWLDS